MILSDYSFVAYPSVSTCNIVLSTNGLKNYNQEVKHQEKYSCRGNICTPKITCRVIAYFPRAEACINIYVVTTNYQVYAHLQFTPKNSLYFYVMLLKNITSDK